MNLKTFSILKIYRAKTINSNIGYWMVFWPKN